MNKTQLWLLVGLLLALPLHGLPARTLTTPLFAIETSTRYPDKLEVLALESPRIFFLNSSLTDLINTAKVALQTHSWVKITTDSDDSEITQIEILDSQPAYLGTRPYSWAVSTYQPSLLSNQNDGRRLFDSLDSYSDADLSDNCFARAHYWSRDMEINFDIQSMKVFVLFTPLYRNKYNFNWWYHVAPYVPLQNEGLEKSQVFDPSYEKAPKPLQDWVFHFAAQAKDCRVAKTLSEYYDNLALGGCVIITANMYHYTPSDLSSYALEKWNCQHFTDLQKVLRAPRPYSNWKDYRDFLPEHCY